MENNNETFWDNVGDGRTEVNKTRITLHTRKGRRQRLAAVRHVSSRIVFQAGVTQRVLPGN